MSPRSVLDRLALVFASRAPDAAALSPPPVDEAPLGPFAYSAAREELRILQPEYVTFMDMRGHLPEGSPNKNALLVRAGVDNYFFVFCLANELQAHIDTGTPLCVLKGSDNDFSLFLQSPALLRFLSEGEGGIRLKRPPPATSPVAACS